MVKKDISIDYYRPDLTDETTDFASVLKSVAALALGPERTEQLNGCPHFLREIEVHRDHILFEMQRQRVNEPAIKGTGTGELQAVALNSNEALSGLTMLLFDTRRNVLVVERNRNGIMAGNLEKYFSIKGKVGVNLGIIIREEALKELAEYQIFRKLKFRLAAVDPEAMNGIAPTLGKSIEFASMCHARTMTMEIGMGHFKGGMANRGIMAGIKELWRFYQSRGDELETLQVEGVKEDEEDITPLDLLQNRLFDFDEVEVSNDPATWYSTRKNMLLKSWHTKRRDLDRIAAAS